MWLTVRKIECSIYTDMKCRKPRKPLYFYNCNQQMIGIDYFSVDCLVSASAKEISNALQQLTFFFYQFGLPDNVVLNFTC